MMVRQQHWHFRGEIGQKLTHYMLLLYCPYQNFYSSTCTGTPYTKRRGSFFKFLGALVLIKNWPVLRMRAWTNISQYMDQAILKWEGH